MSDIVITGIGMVTPLGNSPQAVLTSIRSEKSGAVSASFDTSAFSCSRCTAITDFDPEFYFPENKTLRLMNRDAQLAVTAAKLALADADLSSEITYPAENVALYGSTGVAGMSVEEITRIIQYSARPDGSLDLESFGKVALRRVRPVLSFKILANMPICFVSIFHNIKGPNAVYTPWEGNGAQAIYAGIEAIRSGEVPCALVGGCEVKNRELSFINLQQTGIFDSWRKTGNGTIPGEGAGFLVLEDEQSANSRGARVYARICDYRHGSIGGTKALPRVIETVIDQLKGHKPQFIIAAADGDEAIRQAEQQALETAGLAAMPGISPKPLLGNLFAAAAAVQLGLAAYLASEIQGLPKVMANCFGYGSEQGAFVLEGLCKE